VCAFWLLSTAAKAQFFSPGEVDTTFGFGKQHQFFDNLANPKPGTGFQGEVFALALQPDRKVIVGGSFNSYNGIIRMGLLRIDSAGQHDSSFNTGAGLNGFVHALNIQADGKVLVVGNFNTFDGNPRNRIVRLLPNGSIDPTFQPGTGADDVIRTVVRQPDGKFLIGGNFTHYNGISRQRIARIYADGSLDTTFNPGLGPNQAVSQLALQSDGKILMVGGFSNYNSRPQGCVARLHTNGALDTTFNSGITGAVTVSTVLIQPDGKVLIGGSFSLYGGVLRTGVARLHTDGSLDLSFDSGIGASNDIAAMVLQADGKLIIGGSIYTINMVNWGRIVRLNTNGSVDTTFNSRMGFTGYWVSCLALQSDNKLLAGGYFETYNQVPRRNIARLTTDGLLDIHFNPGTGASSSGILSDPQVHSVALDANNKILVGGYFNGFNNQPTRNLVQLNADGSTDTSFRTGTGASSAVNCIAVQPDGKVLIAGYFTNYNGVARNRIARLNADGSLDITFNPGSAANGTIRAMVLQPDGKIIIAGNFTSYAGNPSNKLARINPDGTFDVGFAVGSGANGEIFMLALQPDGKVLIGGFFTIFNSNSRSRIARLNANGSLDNSFVVGSGTNGAVRAAVVRPNGKIIIGGEFTQYKDVPCSGMVHLNVNGSLDTSINNMNGASGVVRSLLLQPNGMVVVGDLVNSRRVFRILENGNLDTIFANGIGADGMIETMAFQSDGKLIIGGSFSTYNNLFRSRIARIFSPSCTQPIANTTSATAICAGDSKNLQGTAGGTWVLASGMGSVTGNTYNSVAGGAGTVSLYNLVGACRSPLVTFTVLSLPEISITQSGDSLIASSATGSFQWYLNNIAIPGATQNTLVPNQSGLYKLNLTNSQGCTGISNELPFFMAGIRPQLAVQPLQWSTYPVPFEGQLTIEAESPFVYELHDIQGRKLLQGACEGKSTTLQTDHLSSGVYLVNVVMKGQVAIRRVVK